MSILDHITYTKINGLQLFSTTLDGNVKSIVKMGDNLSSYIKIALNMYCISDNKHLAEINAYVLYDRIEVKFLTSYSEHKGNVMKLMEHFRIITDIIRSSPNLNIQTIGGIISCVDYDHWGKLFYIYSYIYPDNKFILNDKYSISEFESIMHKYKTSIINFKIIL